MPARCVGPGRALAAASEAPYSITLGLDEIDEGAQRREYEASPGQ